MVYLVVVHLNQKIYIIALLDVRNSVGMDDGIVLEVDDGRLVGGVLGCAEGVAEGL